MLALILKKEIELKLRKRITNFKKFEQGNSRAIKYSFEIKGKKYIAKYYRPRRIDKYLTTILQNMYHEGIGISGILQGFYSLATFKYCTIVEWVEGNTADLEGVDYSRDQIYEMAEKAATELRKIHHYPVSEKYNLDLKKECNKTIKFLLRQDIQMPYLDEFIRIVEADFSVIDDIQYGITHLDFHMGNIIYNGNDITIIDTETFDITHPWRDLTYALCLNHSYENTYWMCFILSYFEWKIPEKFWEYSRSYVLYHFLKLLVSNYLKGSVDELIPLAEKIYYEYEGMRSTIPKWVRESLKKLEREGVWPGV